MNVTCNVDYATLKTFAKRFPIKFKARLAEAATRAGNYLLDDLVDVIESQSMGWTPLSAKYLEWKAKNGFDTRILIRSSLMKQAIRFKRIGFGGWVGIPAGLPYPKNVSGMASLVKRKPRKASRQPTIGEIMNRHESGDGRPRRPLFGPVYRLARPEITRLYTKALRDAING
jgi:hypothetical protein